MPVVRRRTFCRICEVHCGLIAEVEESAAQSPRVLRLLPDREHPVTRGYCCAKGLRLGEVHHDADRLNHPLRRTKDGFERISWPQAMAEIGSKLRELRAQHDPRTIAMYRGNPSFFSFQHYLFATLFMQAIGSPNTYTSVSIDSNPKFFVATHVYGHPLIQPLADVERTELFFCLGSNPAISQMSIVQLPNALAELRRVVERGGRVVSFDPRLTETARKVGEHVFIRPGTDAYLLMAWLHVIAIEIGVDAARIERHASGLAGLIEAARPWTPERAARVTGIEAARIRELAHAYLHANGACIYVSTGVTMGPFGTLSCWLVQALSVVAGQLDRVGGLLVARGAFDLIELSRERGTPPTTLGRQWPLVAGAFPTAALASEIEIDDPRRIRALFVSGGNPLHSLPGGALARALERLELLVCIDVYPSETCARADYVLPATDMLEHSDFPFGWMLLQTKPYAQFTEAVVPPAHERREEWRIFAELALAAGVRPSGRALGALLPHLNRWLRRLPGKPELTPDDVLAALLWWGGKVTLGELRRHPQGILLEPLRAGDFLGQRVPTASGKVELAPAAITVDLARLAELEASLAERRPGQLRMIGKRERRTHNSWLHNLERSDLASGNTAVLHPEDAALLGIRADMEIWVHGDEGRLRLPVVLSDEILPGVIAVPHGWGHATAQTSRASRLRGANYNSAIPSGPGHMEPPSGQAIMLGHWVRVTPVNEPAEDAHFSESKILQAGSSARS